jgi:hypothetical protein
MAKQAETCQQHLAATSRIGGINTTAETPVALEQHFRPAELERF